MHGEHHNVWRELASLAECKVIWTNFRLCLEFYLHITHRMFSGIHLFLHSLRNIVCRNLIVLQSLVCAWAFECSLCRCWRDLCQHHYLTSFWFRLNTAIHLWISRLPNLILRMDSLLQWATNSSISVKLAFKSNLDFSTAKPTSLPWAFSLVFTSSSILWRFLHFPV